MSEASRICHLCHGEMEEGESLIVEADLRPSDEVEYLKRGASDERLRLAIFPYRCKKCGHVELFTKDEADTAPEDEQKEKATEVKDEDLAHARADNPRLDISDYI